MDTPTLNGANSQIDHDQQQTVGLSADATVLTAKASRYMKALCNHFDRKMTASYTDNKGSIDFPFGACRLTASDAGLYIQVSAENEPLLDRTKDVVARHLVRFGQKDELVVVWEQAD